LAQVSIEIETKYINRLKLSKMAKRNFNRNKPHLNIGTIGRDHGKTTTAAITRCYLMLVTVKQNHLIKLIML
jgi:hypothetical protein